MRPRPSPQAAMMQAQASPHRSLCPDLLGFGDGSLPANGHDACGMRPLCPARRPNCRPGCTQPVAVTSHALDLRPPRRRAALASAGGRRIFVLPCPGGRLHHRGYGLPPRALGSGAADAHAHRPVPCPGHEIRVYTLLQHGGSLAGVTALMIAYRRLCLRITGICPWGNGTHGLGWLAAMLGLAITMALPIAVFQHARRHKALRFAEPYFLAARSISSSSSA